MAAFALVMGLSQCSKPNLPVLNNGGKQHVVLNASWDNGGSKIDQNGKLFKWTKDDKLDVKQNETSIGTLTCINAGNGTFEGTIEATEGNLTFTFQDENYKSDFMNQTGALNDAVYLTSGEVPYDADGNYNVSMTMPHAVLKLDLSIFGTAAGTTVNITENGVTIASVAGVKNDDTSKVLYVAVKAPNEASTPVEDRISKTYGFDCNVVTNANAVWKLANNTFCTKDETNGEAIKIETAQKAVFTVNKGSGKKVCFSNGNLQATYDGSKYTWGFATSQWSRIGNNAGNTTIGKAKSGDVVDLFGWSTDKNSKYGVNNSESNSDYSGSFKDWGGITSLPDNADGNTWFTLSYDEWRNLLGISGAPHARENASKLCALVTLIDVGDSGRKGIVILPDGSSADPAKITTKAKVIENNAVFLPMAGRRNGTKVDELSSVGYYWSSTNEIETSAFNMFFDSTIKSTYGNKFRGRSVRLVRLAE